MNFERINPILQIDKNAVLTSLGDISLGYELILPEVNTIPLEIFNRMHTALMQLFLILPENICIQRQDIFVKKTFDASTLFDKKKDFFENSLYNHFNEREYLTQKSYLYITLLDGYGFKRSLSGISYFKKKTNRKESFKIRLAEFQDKCTKAIVSLDDVISVKALKETDLRELIEKHFNGQEDNKIASPVFKPEFSIGKKKFAIYGLDNDVNQKDGDIDVAKVNQTMSSEISKMYSSYMSDFGLSLGFEHVVNSYIFYDDQSAIKRELNDNRSKLQGIRLLGNENAENARRIEEFITAVEQDDVKVVRSHFNVTVFDFEKEKLLKKERLLQGAFARAGIVPNEYDYMDYPYIYLSNTPGCAGHLPSDYTFLSFTEIGVIYTLFEGNNLKSSNKGIFYCNRNDNVPFRLDLFFKPYEDKLIDNRNYFVVAPSGGGKSFASKSRLYQQHNMGFDQVVINIGGDDKLCKLINKDGNNDALYVVYEDGKTLPINPFFVEGRINNQKIEFLVSFIWLLWGGTDEIDGDKQSILNKIVVNYYDINSDDAYGEKGFLIKQSDKEYSIITFYQFLMNNKTDITEYFDGDSSLFNLNSLIINLEKFAIGNYKTLFHRGKPDLFGKKRYIEFELDNIKDHPFLFPIFSMLISDITFNTMWSDEGYKNFFIDECWKILEKPGMALLLKYLYKTIRKFDGAVGIAVQQITDLVGDIVVEKAILGNCSIKFILNHKNVLEQVPLLKEKLSLKDSDVSMLLSIQNKIKSNYSGDKVRYTEELIIMGSEFSKVVRNEVSPELSVIYDSEKKRLKKFNQLYEINNQNIEKTIVQYLK